MWLNSRQEDVIGRSRSSVPSRPASTTSTTKQQSKGSSMESSQVQAEDYINSNAVFGDSSRISMGTNVSPVSTSGSAFESEVGHFCADYSHRMIVNFLHLRNTHHTAFIMLPVNDPPRLNSHINTRAAQLIDSFAE